MNRYKPASVTHGHKQGLMKRSVWFSAKRAPRMEPDVWDLREQTSANQIALSERPMYVDRIIPQALSLSPRVYTSSWTGFGALNSICTPQGTHDVPWIAAGKAMHEDP
ncbi:MAG: hypothetical protein MRY64_09645 [Hyphomonadaceae bacterium]|nr:hypothetical protein [Hyphomonadaceae bacterium]